MVATKKKTVRKKMGRLGKETVKPASSRKKKVTKKDKARRGRPPEYTGPVYRTVLRIPMTTAKRLKKKAKKHGVSFNTCVDTIINVYLTSENQ